MRAMRKSKYDYYMTRAIHELKPDFQEIKINGKLLPMDAVLKVVPVMLASTKGNVRIDFSKSSIGTKRKKLKEVI